MIETIPKVVGMAYAILATIAIVVLLRRKKFNKRIGLGFLVVSTLSGFLIFAPMLPYQFQAMIVGNTKQLGAPVALAVLVLVAFVVLLFVFGRIFCGYVCPIGTVQELLSRLPVRQIRIENKYLPILVRFGFLVAFVVLAAIFSIGLLRYFGVRDFFYLATGSGFFYVFLGLAALSIFVYRPICRFLYPYGAVLSLAAGRSRFRFRRNGDCINCKKCIEACPTGEAGREDLKQECYMCDRCREVCPVNGLDFSRTPVGSGTDGGQ
jgi:polyferredoxin